MQCHEAQGQGTTAFYIAGRSWSSDEHGLLLPALEVARRTVTRGQPDRVLLRADPFPIAATHAGARVRTAFTPVPALEYIAA